MTIKSIVNGSFQSPNALLHQSSGSVIVPDIIDPKIIEIFRLYKEQLNSNNSIIDDNKTTNGTFVVTDNTLLEKDNPIVPPDVLDPAVEELFLNLQQSLMEVERNSIISVFKCAGSIDSYRLVYLNSNNYLEYADTNNLIDIDNILGITLDHGEYNKFIRVQIIGIINNDNWKFIKHNPLFLSTEGNITQIVPTKKVSKEIGYAISETKIMVWIQKAVIISDIPVIDINNFDPGDITLIFDNKLI